jgi:glycerol-3-phosphate acyltransferase PlsY
VAVVAIVIGYLLGTLPTGYVLTRWIAGADLRSIGSGGTGATNAQRALGWRWGVAVAAVDILKGVLAVLIARWLDAGDLGVALAATAAILGHCWPVWLRFKGGKGVATGAGAAIALTPWALLLIPIMIVPIVLTRYVSLGSVLAATSLPILFAILWLFDRIPSEYVLFAMIVSIVVDVRHRGNIGRLLNGSERKLGRSSANPARSA